MSDFNDQMDDVSNRSKSKSGSGFISNTANKAKQYASRKINNQANLMKIRANFRRDALKNAPKNAVENVKNRVMRVVNFFKKHAFAIKWAAIIILVVALVFNLVFAIKPIIEATGNSVHYYCNINADSETKSSAIYKQYCSASATSADNSTIAAAAVSLAIVDLSLTPSGKVYYSSNGWSDVQAVTGSPGYQTETYMAVAPQIATLATGNPDRVGILGWGEDLWASCDLTVSLAVLWSGSDDLYPMCLGANDADTSGQAGHLAESDDWEELTSGDDIQPGDVAIEFESDGSAKHTYMFVASWENGQWTDNSIVQEVWPGSNSNRFEGSHMDYYSQLSYDPNPWQSDSHPEVRIWRFVGEVNENSIYKKVEG